MSWQDYVDNNIMANKKFIGAAIHGLDGSMWATSDGFRISDEEVEKIVKGYTEPDGLFSSGVHLQGQKFVTIRVDDKLLYAKQGKTGLYAVKTEKALVVGTFEDTEFDADTQKTVTSLADYLSSVGY